MLDKKAKQILFKSFWKNGWIDSKDRQLSIEDFEYAKSKGLMFEPLTINHNEAIDKLISIRDKISSENISEAFLSSLSSKRLDLRSPISSYFLAKKSQSTSIPLLFQELLMSVENLNFIPILVEYARRSNMVL